MEDIFSLIQTIDEKKQELSGAKIEFSENLRYIYLKENLLNSLSSCAQIGDLIANTIIQNIDYFKEYGEFKPERHFRTLPRGRFDIWFSPMISYGMHYRLQPIDFFHIESPPNHFHKFPLHFEMRPYRCNPFSRDNEIIAKMNGDIFFRTVFNEVTDSEENASFQITNWDFKIPAIQIERHFKPELFIGRLSIQELKMRIENYKPSFDQSKVERFWDEMEGRTIEIVEAIKKVQISFCKILEKLLTDINFTLEQDHKVNLSEEIEKEDEERKYNADVIQKIMEYLKI